MAMNLHLRNLMHFVNYMELLNNLQILIPNNKMDFQNEKYGL